MPHFNFNGKPPILPIALLLNVTLLLTFAIREGYSFNVTINRDSIIIAGQPGNLIPPPTSDR